MLCVHPSTKRLNLDQEATIRQNRDSGQKNSLNRHAKNHHRFIHSARKDGEEEGVVGQKERLAFCFRLATDRMCLSAETDCDHFHDLTFPPKTL
jgi:hypothetical protein